MSIADDARAKLEGITPGSWSVDYETSDCFPYETYPYAISGPRNSGLDVPHVSDEYRAEYGHQMSEVCGISDQDAEFIAAAPDLVRGLLAELDQAKGMDLSKIAAVTPCTCSAARAQRDAALATIQEVRDYCESRITDPGDGIDDHIDPADLLRILGGES
ncbi:hypothetical protein SEA_LTON_57 [Gordonia phage Lton]|uniref:Uncharacterized protein n=1 Tax=Gordonia phage Apricot TaxID=2250319 RepID=A0A345L184_9CAUD|nr:hypothetical protein HOT72_gp077 [Gordonia phage Apricot]AXH49036.1 hypothetical protein SEA_APRICOT_77 [Gordonia phage Apricot]UXE05030.1 hypothetical protein SEA_LTON_57 [Gordonia phage Lton]